MAREAGEEQPRWVVALAELDPHALALAGGKAVNLAAMLRAGLPVPGGFCVTTTAYEAATGTTLDDLLEEIEGVPASDTARLAELAGGLRERVLAQPVPDGWRAAIRAALAGLGMGRWRYGRPRRPRTWRAQLRGAAGDVLERLSADAVLEAVRRCWASLWTDRAVAYRASNGIDQRTVRLAVVVQRMVDAAVAGVLFTANPLTGQRRQSVIDASPGLGEAVVSGAVNPDHFVVDSRTGGSLEQRLGDKRLVVGHGGRRHTAGGPGGWGGEPCLSDGQLRDLARLGELAEALFGWPQDSSSPWRRMGRCG